MSNMQLDERPLNVAEQVLGTRELLELIINSMSCKKDSDSLMAVNRSIRAQALEIDSDRLAPIKVIVADKRCSAEDDERDAATLTRTCTIDTFTQLTRPILIAYVIVQYKYVSPDVERYAVDENVLDVSGCNTDNDDAHSQMYTYLQQCEHVFKLKVFRHILEPPHNRQASFLVSYATLACHNQYFRIFQDIRDEEAAIKNGRPERFLGLANILCKNIDAKLAANTLSSFTFVIQYYVFNLVEYAATPLTPFQLNVITFLNERNTTLNFDITLRFSVLHHDDEMDRFHSQEFVPRQFNYVGLEPLQPSWEGSILTITYVMHNRLQFGA